MPLAEAEFSFYGLKMENCGLTDNIIHMETGGDLP
jgi:hypothetical protein